MVEAVSQRVQRHFRWCITRCSEHIAEALGDQRRAGGIYSSSEQARQWCGDDLDGSTNPVDVLPLVKRIGGSLQEQRRLPSTWRPIHLRHFPPRIPAGDVVAWEARRGKQLIELLEAGWHRARAACIEALESL